MKACRFQTPQTSDAEVAHWYCNLKQGSCMAQEMVTRNFSTTLIIVQKKITYKSSKAKEITVHI